MKFVRFFAVLSVFAPLNVWGATPSEFQKSAQLLTAARRGDIQTVQILINSGVDVNYVDSTGMSLVCTAVMNNDTRAIQVLQMYGADASNCDKQIKQYKQKTRVATRGEEYGFFSGLSSTHVVALSAVGAAAVIGGVVLLANVFDDDHGGGTSGTNGDRPNNNNSDSTTTDLTSLFAVNLPYGPLCSGTTCPSDYTLFENSADFLYMSDNGFNYLMVARAYDPFVRGYLGMATERYDTTREVFDLSAYPFAKVPGGGKPINVAMITGTGVNATGSAVDGIISWFDDSKKNTLISLCQKTNGVFSDACTAAVNSSIQLSHKYYNLSGATVDGATENTDFDLSDSGTVFGMASDVDTKLAKIIAGWEEGGRANADYYGFIPNGQLLVYKTGGGNAWVDTTSDSVTSAYIMAGDELAQNDQFTLNDGTVLTVQTVSGNSFVATDDSDNEYTGYLIGDNLFVDSNADGNINQMYALGGENALTLTKELSVADYKNYAAIYDAVKLQDSGAYVSNVVANLSLPTVSSGLGYATLGDAKILHDAASTDALKQSVFSGLINNYYNLNTADDASVNTPGTDAARAFKYLGDYQKQILVNPAGHSLYDLGEGKSLSPQIATFENFAPVVYENLENLFMTVVAVQPKNGTADTTVSSYNATSAGTLALSEWTDENDTNYISRMCGLAGTGNGGAMNPWCFAAPGRTDLDAAAAMAGSVALVKSAFDYMDPQQIFLLLALTADGPYLGTNPETNARWASDNDLLTYLKLMYTLPANVDTSDSQYFESFKNVFGYGMVNLERATQPTTNVFFYDSDTNSIVSSSGKKAYWGYPSSSSSSSSSSRTSSRASSVMSLTGRGDIKTSFYDVIESADGSVSLPRVWNATLSSNNYSRHGIYMGDVLGEFSVDSTNKRKQQIGDFRFDMSISPRAYNDNMNGVDNLSVSFVSDDYDVNAQYQRFLTDGQSRFNGRANGVLALASNAITSGANYKYGDLSVGARAFSGMISDENLLENDPAITAQFEPARLGFANGASVNAQYNHKKFDLNVAFGNMRETNTVLGMYSDGLLALNGANTKYLDLNATANPFENVKLSMRATFANTDVDNIGGIISNVSDIKSNAFALGLDMGGFGFTAAMPLAIVGGKMGYDYADFNVVKNDGKYEIAMLNPHVEYIDLKSIKREIRFSGDYKQSIGAFTDAGIGFIYRVNPNNTNAFGNETVLMLKIHHRLGI